MRTFERKIGYCAGLAFGKEDGREGKIRGGGREEGGKEKIALFIVLQTKYSENKAMLDKLEETNHALRKALEEQFERTKMTHNQKEKEKESKREAEEEWWKPPPPDYTHSPALNVSPKYGNSTNYGNFNEYLPNEGQSFGPSGPNLSHRAPTSARFAPPPSSFPPASSPHLSFPPASSPHLSFSPTSSPHPSYATSSPPPSYPPTSSPQPPSFAPAGNLRRELDDLDKEIEQLQTSLKRQLSEMAGPT